MTVPPAEDGSGDDALLALAADLCRTAGLPKPTTLAPLAGGKNNRVLKVALGTGDPVVLKLYHHDPRDTRNRLSAEWSFLRYVWERGVRTVPQPLAHDVEAHAAIYAYVPGRKLRSDEVDAGAVEVAAAFLVAANMPPRRAPLLAPASEACFSLADHLATIRRRVARLATLDPEVPHRESATALVDNVLRPAMVRVMEVVRARAIGAGIDIEAPISDGESIFSPSDFGFHNALAAPDGTLTFIDFEYAGRDDPAKLACDFFCCPEVQVPLTCRPAFLRAMRDGIGLDEAFVRRADILLDAYRVKWACIVLNDFLPVEAARRAFALPGERAARCAAQLAKAAAQLANIGTT